MSSAEPVARRSGAAERHPLQRWAPLLLVALTFVVYAPALPGDWVWDDVPQYRDNPNVTDAGLIATSDVWGPTGARVDTNARIYRPLPLLSHVPTQRLLRGPTVERVVSLTLHAGVALLVAALALALGCPPAAAWFGAGVLALHPAGSEAVAWISARGDLIAGALLVGGVLALVRDRPAWAGALTALAPFCKEAFLLAPLWLAIWMLALRRPAWRALAIACGGALAYWSARSALGIPMPAGAPIAGLGEALGAVGALALRAAELAALPTAPDALAPYVAHPVVGALVVIAALPAFVALPGRPWLAGLLAPLPLLAATAPASLANAVVADRYFYVALCGAALAAAFAAQSLLTHSRLADPLPTGWEGGRRWTQLLLALPFLAWAPSTFVRAADWRSDTALFEASLARRPDNPKALYQVAYRLHAHERDCQRAIPLYERAMAGSPRAGNNLQACLLQLGRSAEAAALGPALATSDPGNPNPALNTARALLGLGQPGAAEAWVREGMRRREPRAKTWTLLGTVVGMQGRHSEALAAFERALALDPAQRGAREGATAARSYLTAASSATRTAGPRAGPPHDLAPPAAPAP